MPTDLCFYPSDCRRLTVEEQSRTVGIDGPRPWPNVGERIDRAATLGLGNSDQEAMRHVIFLLSLLHRDGTEVALFDQPGIRVGRDCLVWRWRLGVNGGAMDSPKQQSRRNQRSDPCRPDPARSSRGSNCHGHQLTAEAPFPQPGPRVRSITQIGGQVSCVATARSIHSTSTSSNSVLTCASVRPLRAGTWNEWSAAVMLIKRACLVV